MERESDRVFAQLRRALRAEIVHEFMLDRPTASVVSGRLPTGVVGFEEAAKSFAGDRIGSRPNDHTWELRVWAREVMRPIRLCFKPEDMRGWIVMGLRLGTVPLLLDATPIDATAFPPLPEWVENPTAEGTAALAALFPIENLKAWTANPGIQIALTITTRDPELGKITEPTDPRLPRPWLLVQLPPADRG